MGRAKLQLRNDLLKNRNLNIHQVHLRVSLSVTTTYKYLSRPEEVKAADLRILPEILMNGLGMTKSQVMNLKLSDLFEFVEEK